MARLRLNLERYFTENLLNSFHKNIKNNIVKMRKYGIRVLFDWVMVFKYPKWSSYLFV